MEYIANFFSWLLAQPALVKGFGFFGLTLAVAAIGALIVPGSRNRRSDVTAPTILDWIRSESGVFKLLLFGSVASFLIAYGFSLFMQAGATPSTEPATVSIPQPAPPSIHIEQKPQNGNAIIVGEGNVHINQNKESIDKRKLKRSDQLKDR